VFIVRTFLAVIFFVWKDIAFSCRDIFCVERYCSN
jgi:hypothetical protein